MKEYFEGFEVFGLSLLPMLLGAIACLVRQAQYGWRGARQFLRELVICCFMSVLVFWGLDYFTLAPTVQSALSTACAFSSMTLIEALTKKLTRVIRDYRVPGVAENRSDSEDNPK